MTEATQTPTPNDAREASKSRVTTQETLLANLASPAAASEQTTSEEESEEGQKTEQGQEQKPKKTAQERIRELANRNRETEAKAEAAERRARELEQQLQALKAGAPPIEAKPRPQRGAFNSQEEYEDALGDWRAEKIIAERERQQAQARIQAEQQEIAQAWEKRLEGASSRIEDLTEVLGKSEVNVPAHVHNFILESDRGPEIAYYLALHPDEARRIGGMRQIQAIKALDKLEVDLDADFSDEAAPAAKAPPAPKKSKAPPPVEPVKSAPSAAGPASSTSFQDYKRRRASQKG